jgi:hypothetical protein
MLFQNLPCYRIHFKQLDAVAPEPRQVNEHLVALSLFEQDTIASIVAQNQPTVPSQVDLRHLDVGILRSDFILPGEGAAHVAVSTFFMYGLDDVMRGVRVITASLASLSGSDTAE